MWVASQKEYIDTEMVMKTYGKLVPDVFFVMYREKSCKTVTNWEEYILNHS